MRRIIFLVTLLISLATQAQKVTAVLKQNEIRPGEQVLLDLTFSYRADQGRYMQPVWPVFADTITEKIEILSVSGTDTIRSQDDPLLLQYRKSLLLTSFDSGYWAIPPFRFGLKGDTSRIETEPLLLRVTPVAVDTTAAIRPVKPRLDQEYTWIDWLADNMYVVYGALALLVAIIVIVILVKRLRKIKPAAPVVAEPVIPPHLLALQQLDELKEMKLWQEGKLKEYHSQLTTIVREYIERRFRIQALEQTTDEILFSFRSIAVDQASMEKLKQVLVLADLVKFAKEVPGPGANDLSLSNSYEFIHGTKREDEPVQNKPRS